jgi:hypothetical protein
MVQLPGRHTGKGKNQGRVTGATGPVLPYIGGKLPGLTPGPGHGGIAGTTVKLPDPGFGRVPTTHPEFFRKANIGDFAGGIPQLTRGPGIAEYRVQGGKHTPRRYRVTTLLKIRIAADPVHQDKIVFSHRI